MKKVTLKITSIFMVIICCMSTVTISMTSASATVAEDIGQQVIQKYTQKLSKAIGKVPYVGDLYKVLFDYLLGEILPEKEKEDPFQKVQESLDRIEETLNNMAVEQQLSDNNDFNKEALDLVVLCEKGLKLKKDMLDEQALLKEYKEELAGLKDKSEKTKEERTRIAELNKKIGNCTTSIAEYDKSLYAFVTNIETGSISNIITKLEKYINDTAVGKDKNPFKNYFNAQNKKLGFASDALEASKAYESQIMSGYMSAVSLCVGTLKTACEKTENESEQRKYTKQIETIANNCEKTVNAYNKIVEEEKGTQNRYYYDGNQYVEINGAGKARLNDGYVYPNGGISQIAMLDYFREGNDETTYDKYMEVIRNMIKEQYTDFKNYTLRTFLESKGYDIPNDAKYLIAGKVSKGRPYDVRREIPVFALDETSNEVKDFVIKARSGMGFTYINSSELCYFIETKDSGKSAAAGVNVNGNITYYDNISKAWENALLMMDREKGPVTVTLYEDWIADVDASGKSSFGTGTGFKNGAICTGENYNGSLDSRLTLDLNGHTVDRNLSGKKAITDGSVIIVSGYWLTIKNGTITGGNTSGNGGGIRAHNKVVVDNCKITGNYANERGGGISLESGRKDWTTDLYDTEITGNTGLLGGGVSTRIGGFFSSLQTNIKIGGLVKIKDNNLSVQLGSFNLQNDCYLESSAIDSVQVIIDDKKGIDLNSRIWVTGSGYKWQYISEYSTSRQRGIFNSNSSDYTIRYYEEDGYIRACLEKW
ncbi:MAG: hypothetical protein ACI4W1_06685 [Ruminococcus sp.]